VETDVVLKGRNMSERQQFLYRIQPTRPEMLIKGLTPEEEAIVEQHFGYLQDLLGQDILLLAGRTLNTDPSSFGVVIFEAGDDETARQIMVNDPAVRQGVMRAELFLYRVALMASLA
jgi:uncharacterized protein YciI